MNARISMDTKIYTTCYIYFTGKDFTLQRFMINEEYVFHLKWVVMLFQNSVVEKRLVDVICGDKTAGKYETEKNIIIVLHTIYILTYTYAYGLYEILCYTIYYILIHCIVC